MYKQTVLDADLLFDELMNCLEDLKPDDRSDADRHYAILKTELSKSYAYFRTYILNNEQN